MAEALYRKYRPQVFADVVGQDHIVRTLQNAVAQGKVSHAYLFCGPRGTGKTTMARLLSKALLCKKGATPEPDGTCEDCELIAAGAHPDVYELDAASRTGVENVREEIIGRVQFAPTRGASKVYIIDEVHMLSTAAFNALLKTLEEPPSHVVFVLCTTDPQKVPETIHSRCQRFDFRRIGQEAMVAKLGAVCVAEGAQFEGQALELVAHRAEGGLRNALTSLEQLIAFSGGNVTMAAAEDMLGGLDASDVAELAAAIGKRDTAACFSWVARYVEVGGDLAQFARDLAEHMRNLYVMSLAGADVPLEISDAMRATMGGELQWFGSDRLARALCVLGDLIVELKTSTNARLSFEIACVRLARPASDLTLESLAERVESLERGALAPAANAVAATPAATAAESSGGEPAPSVAGGRSMGADGERAASAVQQRADGGDASQAGGRSSQIAREAQPAASNLDPWHSGLTSATARTQPAGGTLSASAASVQRASSVRDEAPAQPASTAGSASQDRPASQSASPEPEGHAAQTPSQGAQPAEAPAASDSAWAKAAGNPAALQRLWQQVMAALKRDKGPYAVLFMNTRVRFDEARGVVCVEFPKEAAFAYKAAQKPEVAESLNAAMAASLGVATPFCFVQAGASAATPSQVQTQPDQVQTQPDQGRRLAQQPDQPQQAQARTQPRSSGEPAAQRAAQEPARQQLRSDRQPRQQSPAQPSQQQPQGYVDDYDRVPLDAYDGFAGADDGRYGDYGAYAQRSASPERGAAREQQATRERQAATQPASAQADRQASPDATAPAGSGRGRSDAPQGDAEADRLWRGNLESAFGSVTVQRL